MLAPSRGSSADPLPCVPNPAPMGCQCDGESGQWVPQTLLPLSTTLSPAGHRFPRLVPCLRAPPGSLDTETTTLPCCPALARCFPTCPPGMDGEQKRVLCALLSPRHGVSPGLVPSQGQVHLLWDRRQLQLFRGARWVWHGTGCMKTFRFQIKVSDPKTPKCYC